MRVVGLAAFAGMSVLSLVLCVFALIVWLLSYFSFAPIGQYWATSWGGNSSFAGHGWIAVNGSLHVLRNDYTIPPSPASIGYRYFHSGIDPIPGARPHKTRWGFAHVESVSAWREPNGRRVTDTTQQLSFPGWLPPLLFSLPPALWLRGFIRRRRLRSAGRCQSCGYNLTGNTSGICPECGTAVKIA